MRADPRSRVPAVVRAAVRAFPREFRRRYGSEMLGIASERYATIARERGRAAARRHLAGVVANVIVSGLAERFRRSTAKGSSVSGKRITMDELLMDLRYGLRLLRRRPGFTLVAVAILAIGIGASSAMFSLVNQVALRSLPFPEPGRLVRIYDTDPEHHPGLWPSSPATFLDWREQLRDAFSGVAAFQQDRATWSGADPAESIPVAQVSAGWLATLGVKPAMGRGFRRDDETPGRDRVVVLSHAFWTQRLGGDSGVVGQTLPLDGEAYTIVGVMPRDFGFPSAETTLWLPLSFHFDVSTSRGAHFLSVIGRLSPEATLASAGSRMDVLMGRLGEAYPDQMRGWGARLEPLKDAMLGDLGPRLWLFLAAVGLLLVVAWVNVANLLTARASAHGRELAVRAAIGADRWRLTRLLVTEGVVIAAAAGAGGIALGWAVLRAVMALAPAALPQLDAVRLDWTAMGFAAGLSLLLGAGLGLVSALRLTRTPASTSLRGDGLGADATPGRYRLQQGLVVAQVTLALVLTVGAGLLVRSLAKLVAVDPGFRAEHGLVTSLSLPKTRYPDQAARSRFLGELIDRLDRMPGVVAAAVALQVPLEGYGISFGFWVGNEAPPRSERPNGDFRLVSRGYFATMGIPILRGRAFGTEDRQGSPPVAIINETLARQFFADRDPIGQEIHIDSGDGEAGRLIVGVVGDIRQRNLSTPPAPAYYQPVDQLAWSTMRVVVRAVGDPNGLVEPLRREVAGLDPLLAVQGTRTLEDVVATAVGSPRFSAFLLGAFALVALLLASGGIYAMTSFLVAQRTHEIGVRLALGERPARIRRAMAWAGLRLALLGIALGTGLAVLASRTLRTLLYGVGSTDALSFGGAALIFLVVAWLGSFGPARRASAVDPLEALRSD